MSGDPHVCSSGLLTVQVRRGVTDMYDVRFSRSREAVWQTIQGSMGNYSFINEYMPLVAATESRLARGPNKKKKKLPSQVETF